MTVPMHQSDQTDSLRRDLSLAVACAAVLGLLSTFGDWVWEHYIPDGSILPGVAHGVVIFVALALLLGWASGLPGVTRKLLLTLPIAGLLLAAVFYPLAYAMGYLGALLATWVGMWLSLALLQRWARGGREAFSRATLRAVVAAIGSGLAFWAISGIWTDPASHTSYLQRLLYWSFAFLPGFAALLIGQHPRRDD